MTDPDMGVFPQDNNVADPLDPFPGETFDEGDDGGYRLDIADPDQLEGFTASDDDDDPYLVDPNAE